MKLKIIHHLTITFFIAISQCVVAQFDISTQIQRPSIEANKLTQNIEVPVNLYTGTVNIEIPIYTIRYNDIIYPIYLSYHGGGIKVSDECGSVGLGWTLNATGVINRIVRGLPDEMNTNGKYGYNHLNNNYKNYINQAKPHSHKNTNYIIYDDSNFSTINSAISLYGPDYDEGLFDSSQDNYMFSVDGKSGVFINNNFQNIVQTDDGCRILQNNINQYTITSQDGFKYIFNDIEQKDYRYKKLYIWESNDDTKPEFNYKHNSSWWLSKLYSPTGDSITFNYSNLKVIHPHQTIYIYSHITLGIDYTSNYRPKTNLYVTPNNYKDTTYHKILRNIETPNCKISFFYKNTNEDEYIKSTPALDSIVIYSKNGTTQFTPIQKFIFGYSNNSERAKLTDLKKIGATGEEETHFFSYKEINITPAISVNDKRCDHWGYFAPKSTGRFSPEPYYEAPDFLINLDTTLYKERNANYNYADNNMLTSIIYPTGNKLELEWEPHSFSQLSYVGNTAIQEVDYNVPDEETTEYYIKKNTIILLGKEGCENELEKTCYLNNGDIISINLSKYYLYATQNPNLLECIFNYDDCDFLYYTPPTILVKKGNSVISETIICQENIEEPVEITVNESGTYTFCLQNPRNMINDMNETCKYYLDIFNMNGADKSEDGKIYIEIYKKQNKTEKNETKNVGGVRIKEIRQLENNSILYTKQYRYILDDENETSSGVLAYPHRYGSTNFYCDKIYFSNAITSYIINDARLLTLHSIGLPYTLGNNTHIEYSRIEETTYDKKLNKEINQTIYNFATSADYGQSDINMNKTWEGFIPSNMIQLTSKKHKRGHLESKIEYTDEVLTTTYGYNIREKENNDTITGAFYTIADYKEIGGRYIHQSQVPYKNVGIIQYQVIPYNKRIANVTQSGDITNSKIKYYYANNEYSDVLNANQPIIIEITNSDNSITRKYISYLGETDKIVSCITTKNDRVIDAYRYEYDSNKRVIKKYITLLENNNLPTKDNCEISTLAESYVYYKNRLVEKTDYLQNISTTYLWSYNNAYIIAEIKYATFEEVKNILNESAINNLMNSYTPDMSIVNNLRQQMPDSYISTITYKPLIGINSYTDERGQSTYYSYDGLGRMTECYIIEDNQKKIIKHFKYKTSQ